MKTKIICFISGILLNLIIWGITFLLQSMVPLLLHPIVFGIGGIIIGKKCHNSIRCSYLLGAGGFIFSFVFMLYFFWGLGWALEGNNIETGIIDITAILLLMVFIPVAAAYITMKKE